MLATFSFPLSWLNLSSSPTILDVLWQESFVQDKPLITKNIIALFQYGFQLIIFKVSSLTFPLPYDIMPAQFNSPMMALLSREAEGPGPMMPRQPLAQ